MPSAFTALEEAGERRKTNQRTKIHTGQNRKLKTQDQQIAYSSVRHLENHESTLFVP